LIINLVVSDLVGENAGNMGGVASDFFGSWIESTCAAIYITSQIENFTSNPNAWTILCFPLLILSSGILTSVIAASISIYIDPAKRPRDVDLALRTLILISSMLMVPIILIISLTILPNTFLIDGIVDYHKVSAYQAAVCISLGIFGTLVHGLTSKRHKIYY